MISRPSREDFWINFAPRKSVSFVAADRHIWTQYQDFHARNFKALALAFVEYNLLFYK